MRLFCSRILISYMLLRKLSLCGLKSGMLPVGWADEGSPTTGNIIRRHVGLRRLSPTYNTQPNLQLGVGFEFPVWRSRASK
jgi:hypothetical protein